MYRVLHSRGRGAWCIRCCKTGRSRTNNRRPSPQLPTPGDVTTLMSCHHRQSVPATSQIDVVDVAFRTHWYNTWVIDLFWWRHCCRLEAIAYAFTLRLRATNVLFAVMMIRSAWLFEDFDGRERQNYVLLSVIGQTFYWNGHARNKKLRLGTWVQS